MKRLTETRPSGHPSTWEEEAKRLRAENERLREVLEKIADMSHSDTCSQEMCFAFNGCDCHVEEARAALRNEETRHEP